MAGGGRSGGRGASSSDGRGGNGGNGGPPDYAGDFSGSPDTSIPGASAYGKAIGRALAYGSMTAEEANAAIESQGYGFLGRATANTRGALSSMPAGLAETLSAMGMPVSSGFTAAGLLAAASGQGMFGPGPADGYEGGNGGNGGRGGSVESFISDPMGVFGDMQSSGGMDAIASSNPLYASAMEGISQQEAQRQKIKELYAPYYEGAVEGGLPQLQALAQGGDVDYTPSRLYEYSKMKGERNIRRTQAAKGQLGSSATEEKLSDLRSGLASEEMDRLYQGQLSRVQLGTGAADAVGSANRAIGGNVSSLYSGLGASSNLQSQSAGLSSGQARQSAYQGLSSGLMGLAKYMEVG